MILILGGAAEGKTIYAKTKWPDRPLYDNYDQVIRQQLAEGKDPKEEVLRFLEDQPSDLILVTAEIGCGMVPVEAGDRTLREATGRVNTLLAERADEVYRVVCGIGLQLK